MKFELPDAAQMQRLAEEMGFHADAAELERIRACMGGLGAGYEALATLPEALPPAPAAARDWREPGPDENPLGAWYVCTDIRGAAEGPLAGKTVAVKDNIFVAGLPMMNGSDILEGFVPEFDATVVTRLLEAGASVRGKSVCEYLCVSGGSATASNGVVQNPVQRGRSAGGSSSGSSALVGAGAVDLALGCDQGGSVRIPSSLSGTCGMKATHGLVPYTGIMGMEASIDYCGPITRSVADNARMLEVLAGYDGYDVRQQALVAHRYSEGLDRGVAGLKIGVVREGFGQALSDPQVDECVRAGAQRLEDLGALCEEVSIPQHLEGMAIWGAIIAEGVWSTLSHNGVSLHQAGPFSPALWEKLDGIEAKLAQMPLNLRVVLMLGKHLEQYRQRFYARAKNHVPRLRKAYDDKLAHYDLLLMPTTVHKAGENPETLAEASDELIMDQAFNSVLNTGQFDATGHPAMSIPCGLREGLPIGLQLVGKHFDEPTIYRAAYAFEQSGDWCVF